MILVMASIGVERIAPGTPHIQYQKIVRAQAAVLVGACLTIAAVIAVRWAILTGLLLNAA